MCCNRIVFNPEEPLAEPHRMLSDEEFVRQFSECELDPSVFSHEAHLRLAWILINREGADKAAETICRLIQNFDQVYGKGEKFNKPLTVAATHTMAHLMLSSGAGTFEGLLRHYPGLKSNFKKMLEISAEDQG